MKSIFMSAGQAQRISLFVTEALCVVLKHFSFCVVQNKLSDREWVTLFKHEFVILLKRLIPSNPYCRERVEPGAFYPTGWKMPAPAEQAKRLALIFPGINLSYVDELVRAIKNVPKLADGIAVVPKKSYLIKNSDGYGAACLDVFDGIVQQRPFYNRVGQLDDKRFRTPEDVDQILKRLEDNTPGDTIVLPFNFGSLYAGWSEEAAKWQALNCGQLPINAAQAGCLIQTVPDRFVPGSLGIDTVDEWNTWNVNTPISDPNSHLYFCVEPVEATKQGQIALNCGNANIAHGGYGLPVIFLP